MFRIIVGCYEQLVIGYTVTSKKTNNELQMEPYFSDHSQTGCIKCLAAGSRYIASGSSDETICLYDMHLGEELGCLQGHSGAITQILFPDKQHLISASDDGNILIWEASPDGTLLKTLKGHSHSVTSFAIHPSGKLGMSVSPKDGTLRTWNMMTGKCIYIKNFKHMHLEFVRWSNDGKHYVLASLQQLQIYELASAKRVFETNFSEQILTIEFLAFPFHECIVVGDSDGSVRVLQIPSGNCALKFKAHETRIKCLKPFSPPSGFSGDKEVVWLVTASSDGSVKVWNIDHSILQTTDVENAECLLTINTTARLTCVTVWHENLKELTSATFSEEKQSESEVSGAPIRKRKRNRKKKFGNRKKSKVEVSS